MERIALIAGNLVIYWRPLLVTSGAVTAILFFLAFYLRKPGNGLSAACAVPLALILSLFLSRLLHWYCRSASYPSLAAAITDYTTGGYALLGAFVGSVLAALILRLLRISRSLLPMLDSMSLAGAGGIAVGRLASFFDTSDRGPIVQSLRSLPWVSPIRNQTSGAVEYRLAVFLFQAMVAGGIFLILTLYYLVPKKKSKLPEGDTCILFLLFYGASQVLLDSIRYDSLFFRSNGFVSIVQVAGALAIVLAVVVFSVRLVKKTGLRPWHFVLWLFTVGLLGLAGYMEYVVQRYSEKAVFAYSVMSVCLLLIICIALAVRKLSTGLPFEATRGGRFLRESKPPKANRRGSD